MAIPQNQVGLYAYLELKPEDGADSPDTYESANIQEATLKIQPRSTDASGLDDEADVNVATTYGWTVSAKKGVVTEDFLTLWASGVHYCTVTLKAPGSKSGSSLTRGKVVGTGMAIITSLEIGYRRGEAVVENIELQGTGVLEALPSGGGGGGQQEE